MTVKELIHILLDLPQDNDVWTDEGHKIRSCDIGMSAWIKCSKLPKEVIVICTNTYKEPYIIK